MDALVREPWGRHHCDQGLHLRGRAAGFFLQLSCGAVRRSLSRVQTSCRDLVEIAVRGISILPEQEDLRVLSSRVRQKGHDGRRARMTYDVDLGLAAVR